MRKQLSNAAVGVRIIAVQPRKLDEPNSVKPLFCNGESTFVEPKFHEPQLNQRLAAEHKEAGAKRHTTCVEETASRGQPARSDRTDVTDLLRDGPRQSPVPSFLFGFRVIHARR